MEHKCDQWSVKRIERGDTDATVLRYDAFPIHSLVFHLFVDLTILSCASLTLEAAQCGRKVNMVHFSSENQLSLNPYWKGRSKLERYFANYSKWNILFAIYFVEGAGPDSQSPTFRDRFTRRQTDSDTWIYKFIISSFLQLKHFIQRGIQSLGLSCLYPQSKTFLAAKT